MWTSNMLTCGLKTVLEVTLALCSNATMEPVLVWPTTQTMFLFQVPWKHIANDKNIVGRCSWISNHTISVTFWARQTHCFNPVMTWIPTPLRVMLMYSFSCCSVKPWPKSKIWMRPASWSKHIPDITYSICLLKLIRITHSFVVVLFLVCCESNDLAVNVNNS